MTFLLGLAFPLFEINPNPNIDSSTGKSGARLTGVPTKWLTYINTKSKGAELGWKEVYKERVSKLA